jgi:hypothetical protein
MDRSYLLWCMNDRFLFHVNQFRFNLKTTNFEFNSQFESNIFLVLSLHFKKPKKMSCLGWISLSGRCNLTRSSTSARGRPALHCYLIPWAAR